MADEPKTPVEPTAQEKAPKAEEEKLYLGKFKTPEDMATSFVELENKLSQQGEDLNKLRQFQSEAYPIIDLVYSNDDLMSQVRQAADAKYTSPEEPKESKENGKTEPKTVVDPRANETEAYLRQKAIDDFKSKHGITALSPEDQVKVDKAMMNVMGELLPEGLKIPLEKTEAWLEHSYSKVQKDKLVEDKVLESLANQATNQRATMSPMTGESPSDSGAELTETERKFAEKLGVNPEDVRKYKERAAKDDVADV